ncbi:MAG TPA: DNA methyltransferase [Pyrinomonadaceae bacterium]|nr:DNA methyltransferase [Pyrinomonadaceae bacterium]
MPNGHEQKFLNALRDIFVGAKIEGDSGYINLMRIKSRYYTEGVFPKLMEKIETEIKDFPTFREELFDKLFTFFKRYFSESGSIYFRHTPYYQDIYERIYTDDRDVMLFWKTQNLYYVKTDRLFRSLTVALDDAPDQKFAFDASKVAKQTFDFDASTLQNKRNNEKRSLIFSYDGIGENESLKFSVDYSKGATKTKVDDILRAIRRDGVKVNEDQLTRAFSLFERQSEVDFFINKNAKAFLNEQFDLWMYQYLFKNDSTDWAEKRIKQMQALKRTAYAIIEFIAQFEDELVRIWNKPKFALASNYVITFDRVFGKSEDTARKLLAHEGMTAQIAEWQTLGIIDDDFTPEKIFETEETNGELFEDENANDAVHALNAKLRFLPFDTKHFKSLEIEILALFDNLDEELDGRLIHSENYQALNTLKEKFREKVKCIHIDPPYNTATSGFEYENTYKHASWLSMMSNRVDLSLGLMSDESLYLCHIDENEYERLQLLFDQTPILNAGTIIWDKRNPMTGGGGIAMQHEYIVCRTNHQKANKSTKR